jgi:TolA-binding protein
MKKTFLITVLGVSAVLAAAVVHAQTTSPTPSTSSAAAVIPSTVIPAAAANVDPALFSLHKQKQLDSINEHIAKMQKRQACIQTAENEKALSSCSGVVGETAPPAPAAKAAPVAVTVPATATLPPGTSATLPASTPATPVKP